MEETVFVAGTKDSSFFLSFPAVFILRGSLEEAKNLARKVLRLIQTSNLRTIGARVAAHQLANAAQFLRPQLVRMIARGFGSTEDTRQMAEATHCRLLLLIRSSALTC
jgi:hypothetical protein